jgi:hypothetical protein
MAHKINCAHCKLTHATAAEVRDCAAQEAAYQAEIEAELYAEAVMSWVAGGGAPGDAGRYAAVVAAGGTWDGGLGDDPRTGELCPHGLDAGLCEGPQHYPMDM